MARRERYDHRQNKAKKYPIYLGSISFMHDQNTGFLIRTAGCFGVKELLIVGDIPERKVLNPLSGSLYDYVNITKFNNPRMFIDFLNLNNIDLIVGELTEASINIHDYKFNFERPMCLFVGHEEIGVPIDILLNAKDVIEIPMPGVGACLNSSQTANILLYEAVKQYEEKNV